MEHEPNGGGEGWSVNNDEKETRKKGRGVIIHGAV